MSDSDAKPKPLNILALDGGGGLNGKQLRPCDVFDIICGTSTGGLVAIMLGRLRMSVDDAIHWYRELSKKVFEKQATGSYSRHLKAIFWQIIDGGGDQGQPKKDGFVPMYDASILEAFFKDIISKKNESANAPLADPLSEENTLCRTFVVAVTQAHGDAPPKLFRSYHTDATQADTCPIWAAARATAAMRPFFPAISVGKPPVTYMDGAYAGANNPAEVAIEEALDIFPDRPIGCLLSLGTGIPDVIPVKGDEAKISDVYQKLLTSCERVHEAVGRKSLREQRPYFRFSVNRGFGNIALNEWDREELTSITERYMDGYIEQSTAKMCVAAWSPQAIEVATKQLELEEML